MDVSNGKENVIRIESVAIIPENIDLWKDYGMFKSNGSFVSIKEQYENKTRSPMMGFYMTYNGEKLTKNDYDVIKENIEPR